MKIFGKLVGFSALISLLFVLGFSWRDLQQKRLPDAATLGSLVGARPLQAKVSPLKVFRSGYSHILQEYGNAADPSKLKYAGLSGMMASLGDPHTVFMEPRMAAEFKVETKAQFAGVGARLGPDPLGARVSSVFDDSPAKGAGVRAGDLITEVDGKSVSGETTDEIANKVRGPVGTKVTLTITRAGTSAPLKVVIRRAQIVAPTVISKMLDGGIGYISITVFSEPSAVQFERAMDAIEKNNLNGLIIDVRGNPGGLLESVRDILSLFVENKTAVTLKMRGGSNESTVTLTGKKHTLSYPIVVLVNGESASAAEILAGVLKDYQVATLVGEHTYGKASVQNVISFRDGSSAKYTIARYYLPSGDDIGRKVDEDGVYISGGIKVDIEVKLQDTPAPILGEPKSDNQLMKAIEHIQHKSKKLVRGQAAHPGSKEDAAVTA